MIVHMQRNYYMRRVVRVRQILEYQGILYRVIQVYRGFCYCEPAYKEASYGRAFNRYDLLDGSVKKVQ